MRQSNNNRRFTLLLMALASLSVARAQDGQLGYQFLNVPISAHSAALGGANISIQEDDASLMWTNAALLSGVADKTLHFGFTSYIRSSSFLSAGFVKAVGERGTLGVGAQMLNYGTMDETDEQGNTVGDFTAKDMNIQASYTYMLTDYWSGALSAKAVVSNYANYSCVALGADVAVNYFDPSHGFSFSAVGRNIGGQVSTLYDDGNHESLPSDFAIGVSKDFANAPLRVSLTADDLGHWDGVTLLQHLVLGVDVLPSRNTWMALGYNLRRAHEMKVADKSKLAGLAIGAGLNVKKFKVGIAFSKYHVSTSALLINAAYSL